MTTVGLPIQDQQILQQLLNAIEPRPAEETPQDNAVDYNWDSPSRFSLSAREGLQKYAKRASRNAVEALNKLLRTEYQAEPPNLTEYYGRQINDQVGDAQWFGVQLMSKQEEVGLMLVPRAVGAEWTSRLLGGNGKNVNPERPLSSLEEVVLVDALRSLLEHAVDPIIDAGGKSFTLAEKVYTDENIRELETTDEYSKLTFQTAEGSLAEIIVSSEFLDPVAGSGGDSKRSLDADKAYQRMFAHISHMPVRGNVSVGSVGISMRDVMSLEAGDVLILNRRPGEPITLTVSGQDVAYGRAAQAKGQYAIQITSLPDQEGNPEPNESAD
jgi:flagellar motor switch protein FliM